MLSRRHRPYLLGDPREAFPRKRPHLSNHGAFAVLHNGIIENAAEFRNKLVLQGLTFHSQNDTKIIANLLVADDTGDTKSTLQKARPLL